MFEPERVNSCNWINGHNAEPQHLISSVKTPLIAPAAVAGINVMSYCWRWACFLKTTCWKCFSMILPPGKCLWEILFRRSVAMAEREGVWAVSTFLHMALFSLWTQSACKCIGDKPLHIVLRNSGRVWRRGTSSA